VLTIAARPHVFVLLIRVTRACGQLWAARSRITEELAQAQATVRFALAFDHAGLLLSSGSSL